MTSPFDRPRATRLMQATGMNAVLAWGGANFQYVSGYRNYFDNPGGSVVLLPADPGLAPMILVASWMEDAARAASRIPEIETYPLWLEIGDLEAMRAGTQPQVEKPVPRFDLRANMRRLANALTVRGLAKGRIGLEMNLVSVQAFGFLREFLPDVTFVEAAGFFADLRMIKTGWEIAQIAEATRIAEAGLLALTEMPLGGLDTAGLAQIYDRRCAEVAGEGFLGTRVTASIGGAVSPTVAGGPRITGDELVFFDCGASIHGYGSDTGRTLTFGPPTDEARRIMDAVLAGMDAAIALIAPGVPMCDLFHAAQGAVRASGLEWYTRGHVGHAMGLNMAEQAPFLSPLETRPLEPGMVIALETPLYVRGLGGFQVEECFVITEKGYEKFTTLPRDFIQVKA